MNNDKVLDLWRITIRVLSLTKEGCEPFCWHVAIDGNSSEKKAVDAARQKFTAAWWDERIIIGVELVGRLHSIRGQALYE